MSGRDIVSQAVITRLPRYFRFLESLRQGGVERISSQELSGLMGVTASQIRQDFNNFGGFGQQGYGYNVEHLYQEIGKLMGVNREYQLIIAGEGRLERAIADYMNVEWSGFTCIGLFDFTNTFQTKDADGIPLYSFRDLPDFVKKNRVDIAVLAILGERALEAAKQLADSGIRAIWNFTHMELHLPKEVQVENVHIFDSLMRLTYKINQHT